MKIALPSKTPTGRARLIGLGALGLAAVLALVWFFFLRPDPAPEVATSAARTGDLEQVVLATGTLEPLELVSVGAQASGRVEKLAVDVGDVVQAGQLIAEIDSQTQQSTLRDRQAALANARATRAARAATLAQAQQDFERQRTMLAADATPRADYDAAQATLNAARAEVQALDAQIAQAQASLESAQTDLGYTRITAPISGTVVAVVTEEGQTVNANQSAPTIVMIAQLDTMTVRTEISEADVIKVKDGMPVYFSILGDTKRRFEGTLRQVEPAPESIATESSSTSSSSSSTDAAVYYMGLIDVPNTDGVLRPSMTAQVSIVLNQAKNAVLIPLTALGPEVRSGVRMVRVVDAKGRIEPRQVQTGIDNGTDVQIVSGLKAGEKVVIGEASAEQASTSGMGRPPGGLGGMGGPPRGGGPR